MFTCSKYIPEEFITRCVGNIREQKFVSSECNISEPRALAQRLAILSRISEVSGSNLDRYSNYPVVVLAFTQFFRVNIEILVQIKQRPLPFISSRSHYSSVILPFDAMQAELLAVSLNKL